MRKLTLKRAGKAIKRKTKTPRGDAGTASTILRAYRFDNDLFERFEADCARHLRNPRSVLEALIRHWLEAGPPQRDAIAERYQRLARRPTRAEARS